MTRSEPFVTTDDCEGNQQGPEGGLAFDANGTLWAAATSFGSLERITLGPAAPSALAPFARRRGALRGANVIAAGSG